MSVNVPSGWPIVTRGLLMTYVGSLCFVRITDKIGEAAERTHERELARGIDARSPHDRVCVLYDVPISVGISALARSSIARLLNEREDVLRATTAAFALATPSAFVRGMLSAVFWVAPPPYPQTMTSDRGAALAFLAQHLPELDPATCETAIVELLRAHASMLEVG